MSGKKDLAKPVRRRHAAVGQDPVVLALGDRIREARLSAGMTQEELALVTGLDRKLVMAVENGKPGVAVGTVARLATALGLRLRAES